MPFRNALLLPALLLLTNTCQKPLPVHAGEAIAEQQLNARHARQASGASSSKDFNNGGVYWVSADGPDFQMWPAMGSAYGSSQFSSNLGGAAQQAAANQGQPQQQGIGQSGGQPPSMLTGQQQQQIATVAQQMLPQMQQNFQQSAAAAFPAYGQMGQQQGGMMPGASMVGGGGLSPYAGYLEKQISSYPVMIYTLADCIPCQRAKHLLAVHYPDVRAHYLELSGNEPWQQQLQIDLQYLTGAMTFPYIFVCGQYIGGSTELFELHENGQLRRLVAQCLQKPTPK